MAASTARYKKLKAELGKLQKLADDQKHHYVKSTQLLYEGLSSVYLWWQEANKEEGLLEKLYDEYNIQFKKQTKQDIPFSPLLKYLWNMDGSLKPAKIDQYNKALNNLHKEVQINKQYFKTNTLQKLITLISNKGGIIKMAGYGMDEPDSNNGRRNSSKPKKLSKDSAQKLDNAHLENGQSYFATALPIAKLTTHDTLSSVDSGLALAVIRKEKNGYDIVATVDDKNLIDQAVTRAYKRTSNQMPYTARLITEIIRSQLLPTKIADLAPSLVDTCNYKPGNKTLKRKQLKRLMYIAKDGTFVLSTNRSSCSVVTTANPIQQIFKKKEKKDLALAVNDRTYIENNLIHTDNFNFYTTDSKRYVSKTSNETASYKMKLENTVTKDYRFIRFYHLSTYNSNLSRIQATVKLDIKFNPKYETTITPIWIREMYYSFLDCWVNGFGKKMKRPENESLKLTFDKSFIAIYFNKTNGDYAEHERIDYGDKITANSILTANVLSRDFIPVLNALTTLEINGNVKLAADKFMLQLQFTTDCADYCISVPFCDEKGKRFDEHMEAYGNG